MVCGLCAVFRERRTARRTHVVAELGINGLPGRAGLHAVGHHSDGDQKKVTIGMVTHYRACCGTFSQGLAGGWLGTDAGSLPGWRPPTLPSLDRLRAMVPPPSVAILQ